MNKLLNTPIKKVDNPPDWLKSGANEKEVNLYFHTETDGTSHAYFHVYYDPKEPNYNRFWLEIFLEDKKKLTVGRISGHYQEAFLLYYKDKRDATKYKYTQVTVTIEI